MSALNSITTSAGEMIVRTKSCCQIAYGGAKLSLLSLGEVYCYSAVLVRLEGAEQEVLEGVGLLGAELGEGGAGVDEHV